jgi:DNA-binding NarL/FixJ family response regulator
MKKLRLLLIEDNRLLREGLTVMLRKQQDMNVVETVGNGENILAIMKKQRPDVMLLDLGLRSRSSLNLVKLVKKNFSGTKIIVMDLIPLQADVLEFVQAGVSGFILKDATVNDFLNTIRSVASGCQILPPNLTGSLFSQIVDNAINRERTSEIIESVRMTKREKQVIELISEGYSNKEIARQLHLSPYTVKSHVHNILEKLALSTRVQIAKYLHDSKKIDSAIQDISLLDE